jgi:hypothetical protein
MTESWRVEAAAEQSLRAEPDDALLVLRLGIAVTALRASQWLTISARGGDSPAEQSIRLWAFMLALSYLHEIRISFNPCWPRIKALADAAGAPPELAGEVSDAILSGKSKLSEVVARIRNQTVFHFDEEPVRDWLRDNEGEKGNVIWLRGKGDTNSGIQYRASTDVASWNILPDVDAETPIGQALMIELMQDCKDAQQKVTTWFGFAIAGHLNAHGAFKRED